MSDYAAAIASTIRVVETRAKYFRNQIVVVVFVGATSIACATVARSLLPLLGMFLLVPVCGFFFFADSKLLHQWRVDLFASWVRKDLDFFAFCSTVRAIPSLPKETLEGMLATLPVMSDLLTERAISGSTRQAVAATALALGRITADSLALKACAAAIVVISLALAIFTWRWSWLIGVAAVVPAAVLYLALKGRHLAMSQAQVLACRAQADFSDSNYSSCCLPALDSNIAKNPLPPVGNTR
jgi:hypothetical protein